MGELDNNESKEDGERSKSIVKSEDFANDDDDCLPEHLIHKKKKKKKNKGKEKEGVGIDENTQQQNHEEITDKMSECNDKFVETIEGTRKKAKKSSRHLHLIEKDEHNHCEINNSKDSSMCRVEEKEKDVENERNFDNYYSGTTKNDFNKDDSNHRKYPSSPENHSETSSSSRKKKRVKSKELTSKSVESLKKRMQLNSSEEFIESSITDSDMRIDEKEARDETAKKLKKKKKKRRHSETEVNRDDIIDCDQPSTEKTKSKSKGDQEICMNVENIPNNNGNGNKSNSSTGEHSNNPIPRIKQPKLSDSEVKAAKIIKHDEGELDDDIHPLQQHPPLDAESISKLTSICINFTHEVPPQHHVENLAGTRVPTKAERKKINQYVEIKRGPFTTDEDEKIVRNWKKFCKKYNWDKKLVHPFLHVKRKGFFYISPVSERKKFVQLLARGLPTRTLYSVYHRFRNLFSNHKVVRYSEYEDRVLLKSIQRNLDDGQKPNYAILAKKFNRTRASVWRRYVLLTQHNKESESVT